MNDLKFAFRQLLKNPGFAAMTALPLALGIGGNTANSLAASANQQENKHSPRLASLVRELEAGNRQALATFWKEMEGKAPLVESMGGDQRRRRITFVWRASNETTGVTMMGGFPAANLLKRLARLADTDQYGRDAR